MVLLERAKKRPCLQSTNGVKAAIVTSTLIGQPRFHHINRVPWLAVRPGRSQDLYEQSFADGVDFLKGIPPQRGLPCSGPHHCLWLPSSHDSHYLGAETHREFEIQPRKYSKMLQLCQAEAICSTWLLVVTQDTCRLYSKVDSELLILMSACIVRVYLSAPTACKILDHWYWATQLTSCCSWVNQINPQEKKNPQY